MAAVSEDLDGRIRHLVVRRFVLSRQFIRLLRAAVSACCVDAFVWSAIGAASAGSTSSAGMASTSDFGDWQISRRGGGQDGGRRGGRRGFGCGRLNRRTGGCRRRHLAASKPKNSHGRDQNGKTHETDADR